MSLAEDLKRKGCKVITPQEGGQACFVRSNVDVAFFGGTLGGGKENSLQTDILTPNGWVKMRDIKVGDIISTPFNGTTRVSGVYPQGVKKIYVLKTKDGREAECGLEHLWEVRTRKQIHKYRKHGLNKNFTVLTTAQIIDALNKGKKLYIPLPNAQEFPEKEFIVDPYLLGVLIGDGCLTVNRKEHICISNSEQDLIDKVTAVSNAYKSTSCYINYNKNFYSKSCIEINKYLHDVGLNTHSYNRFIPKEYLWGSIEQRRQLLFGLMDTDGCVEAKNRYSYSTTSKKLADDFIYLCRSLGYIATLGIDKREGRYTKGAAYNVRIQTDDIIFSSKKHLDKYKENLNRYPREYGRTNDHVLITDIVYKDEEEAQCIYVEDKDHLYIIDDFITTHNTFGSILSVAEAVQDSNFKAVFLRKNLGDLKTAGGVCDGFYEAYGDLIDVKMSDTPRITFPSKAYIEARHLANEDPKVIIEQWKGVQVDALFWEELTGYKFETFKYIMSRCRGAAKWSGKIRATLNPKKNHWVRKWLNWYIDNEGYIRPDRDRVVRYFYINGDTIDDVIWGNSKDEVYKQCRIDIDRKMASLKGKFNHEDLIKSFVFIKGNLAENSALLKNNPGYIGNVASTGGKMSKILIEGNWNCDEIDDTEAPIPSYKAREIEYSDPQRNGDMWITADLADKGTDNVVAFVWDGLHIIDYMILGRSTPRQNADALKLLAVRHNIPDSHIIFDGNNAAYINDYIEDAIPFISYSKTIGVYYRAYASLKDECYHRVIHHVNNKGISFEDKVAKAVYTHENINDNISIFEEFVEECSVVRMEQQGNGRKRLLTKKEMNRMLGKGRSMDVLDPIAMRFLPLLQYELGDELLKTRIGSNNTGTGETNPEIYKDDFWA